jgi:prepilin-type N-terminal cleavage/methylation domain-containing protein
MSGRDVKRLIDKQPDQGFTLIELLIVITILPLIVGAVGAGMITTLDNKTSTTTRLSDSHDAQITATYLSRDVQHAQHLSTTASPALCGSNKQVLGMSWTAASGNTVVTDAVSYAIAPTTHTLVRTFCANNQSSTSILAHDVFPVAGTPTAGSCPTSGFGSGGTACGLSGSTADVAVTVTCADNSTDTTCTQGAGVLSTTPQPSATPIQPGIATVQLDVQEAGSQLTGHPAFTFHVTASPRGTPASGLSSQNGPAGLAPPLVITSGGMVTANGQCSMNVNGVAAINSANPGLPNNLTATEIYSQSGNPYSSAPTPPAPPYVVGPVLSDPFSGFAAPTAANTNVPIHTSIPTGTTKLDGVYILSNGFKLASQAALTTGPDGVLIYLTGGSLDLTGGSSVTLTKPVSDYSPVVIWVDAGDSSGSVSLGGNAGSTAIGGTIYAPTGTVSTQGTPSIIAGGIVANTLHCGGSSSIGAGPTDATSTSLVASPTSPSTSGKAVTLTATVSDTPHPATNVNDGNVAFQVVDKNGATTADCGVPVPVNASGVATCVTGNLDASLAPYTITASYQGDNATFGASLPTSLTQKVYNATTTTLTANAGPTIVTGTQVVFTAQVAANTGSATPSGPVNFVFTKGGGSAPTCAESASNSPTLVNGSATCTVTLQAPQTPVGVTATYLQNPPFFASTGSTITEAITKLTSSIAVVSSKPVSRPGNVVTFSATVSPKPGTTETTAVVWSVKAAGGASVACAASPVSTTLTAGVATCQINANQLTVAGSPYTVIATYAGDATQSTATSTAIQQTVSATPPTIPSTTTGVESVNKRPVDTATVVGSDGLAPTAGTGSVSFYLCAITVPATGCTTTTTLESTVTLANGKATYRLTSAQNPSAKGTYCFAAYFSGDVDYQPSSDTSADQCFTV